MQGPEPWFAGSPPKGQIPRDLISTAPALKPCHLWYVQALKHASVRSLVGSEPQHDAATNLQALVLRPGKFNLQPDIARCRRSCRKAAGCNAWVYCWELGGCDDGRDVRADLYPYQVEGVPRKLSILPTE